MRQAAAAAANPCRFPYPVVLVTLVLTELVAALESSMIFAALPRFMQTFGNPIGVGWLLTAYMLVSAVAAALCSRLGDLYGRRRVLCWVLLGATAGSVVSALSSQLEWVIAGRAVQGVAGAILPLCFGMARDSVSQDRLAFTVSVVGSAAGIGGGLGFLFGGLIIDWLDWHWLFAISACVSAGVWAMVLWVLPASRPTTGSGPLDVWGGVLFAPGIAALLLGLSMGRTWHWLDVRTLGCILLGAGLLLAWVRHELRQDNPLIDVRQLTVRQIALANMAFCLLAMGPMNVQVFTILLQQPLWTGVGLGQSATMTGLLKFPSVFVAMLAGGLCGHIVRRHGGRAALMTAAATATLGWLVMLINHSSVPLVVGIMLLSAMGTTMAFGAVANLVVDATARHRTSEATGLTQVIRSVGMAVGSQGVAVLMASSTVSHPAGGPGVFPDATAYTWTITFVLGACAFAWLAATALRPARPAR